MPQSGRFVLSHPPTLSNRFSSCRIASALASTKARRPNEDTEHATSDQMITLSTATLRELETILTAWGYPKFRANQVWTWLRRGVVDVEQMTNLPKQLRNDMMRFTRPHSLEIAAHAVSKDGTVKRAYRCTDGQVIESVLMPYDKKGTQRRYTACISSQAGCAQGCVFCATGQMGFARQLTSDEIVEQVARYITYLQETATSPTDRQQSENSDTLTTSHNNDVPRLSNIVFMGMGEPLANYRNVVAAIQRLNTEFGIGARKITVSTVGIVPNIRKLAQDLPQVRLAVSLHCANDAERSALLPANARYGGLHELMTTLRDYMTTTGRRITLEWALIQGENDDLDTAHELVQLVGRYLRRDMVHVNVIPLNPTSGFAQGSPSQRSRVDAFCRYLEQHGIACTPRMRRGIDIDAGCGQLKASVLRKEQADAQQSRQQLPNVGVYEDFDDDDNDEISGDEIGQIVDKNGNNEDESIGVLDFEEDWEEIEEGASDATVPTSSSLLVNPDEAARLISLVKGSVVNLSGLERDDKDDH